MPSRVVRAEINSSESLSRVSLEADLTFRALIVAVDDYGRADARPAMLKALLFPTRPQVTERKLMRWVHELAEEGCVQLYSVDGRDYLQLTGWEQHRSNQRRAATSRFPAPEQGSPDIRGNPGDPGDPGNPRRSPRLTSDECRVTSDERDDPSHAARAPEPWASRLSALFYEELASVPGARIPRGAVARGAWEIEALAREAPELAKTEDPAPHIEAGIRFALGPENVGREYEVVVRSARALRQKWPQLVASARRWKRERSKSAEGLEGRVLDLARARSSGEGGA